MLHFISETGAAVARLDVELLDGDGAGLAHAVRPADGLVLQGGD